MAPWHSPAALPSQSNELWGSRVGLQAQLSCAQLWVPTPPVTLRLFNLDVNGEYTKSTKWGGMFWGKFRGKQRGDAVIREWECKETAQ